MTIWFIDFTPDVVTILNLDNLQKYWFERLIEPVYFADRRTVGMILCISKNNRHFKSIQEDAGGPKPSMKQRKPRS